MLLVQIRSSIVANSSVQKYSSQMAVTSSHLIGLNVSSTARETPSTRLGATSSCGYPSSQTGAPRTHRNSPP